MKMVKQWCMLALLSSAAAVSARVVTIDSQRLFSESQDGKAVLDAIESRNREVSEQNQKDFQALQARAQKFQKQAALMAEDLVQLEAAALRTEESKLQLEAQSRANSAKIWAQHQQTVVMRKQMETINQIRDEHADWEAVADHRTLVAWDKKTDVTDLVLKRMDELAVAEASAVVRTEAPSQLQA